MISKTLNRIDLTIVTLVTASLLLAPMVSFAQTTERTKDNRFCSNLETSKTKLMSALDKQLATAIDRYEAHLAKLDQKKTAALAQLETKRDQVDLKWEEQIAKIKAKAKTDAQRAAIDTYSVTVDQLVEDRRADVNTAVTDFSGGVGDIRDTRNSEYKVMVETHRADVEAAFTSAEEACAEGVAPATAATALRTDLSTAREDFRQARQAFSQKSNFTELRKIRTEATSVAREEFRQKLQEANKALRAALGIKG